jgi:outer membrane protein
MTGRYLQSATAIFLAWMMAAAPAFAQASGQTRALDSAPAQQSSDNQSQPAAPPAAPQQQASPPANAPETSPQAPVPRVSFGPNYSNGKPIFPNFISPYTPPKMDLPILTNSPRIDQLIQDGKLMLSLEDAVSLALENNLDIYLQRFTPWIAETDLLRAKAGGVAEGLATSANIILGTAPSFSFDPSLTGTLLYDHAAFPANNPFTTGTGQIGQLFDILQNTAEANVTYTQGFHYGTGFQVSFQNIRTATNLPDTLLSPAWQPTITVTLQQQLLKGFGKLPNTRYIIEAGNTTHVAELQLITQVIASVTNTKNAYWELVYADESVKVEEAAVATSQRLYEDNQKQVQIGTLAPIEIVRAESQLATDKQNLIVAQTVRLQDETTLLNLITKDPLSKGLVGIEIVPTTPITGLPEEQLPALDQAVQQAWQKRPELQSAQLNLKNAGIEVKVTKNALLPTVTLFGQYATTSIAGDEVPDPLVKTPLAPTGLADAYNTMFSNKYPTYVAGFNFTVPIRNRSAQADAARAELDQRQLEVQYRQLQNQIVLGVRNAQIALTQDRAQVTAAERARVLAQETLDAEMKKYQLGASTTFLVIQDQRDLTAAEGTELRAKINLLEAEVNYDQALGRTLDVNRISVADSVRGKIYNAPLIPGTPDQPDGKSASGGK